MTYLNYYRSPIGQILLAADDVGLIGLWIEGQKFFGRGLESLTKEKDLPIFNDAKQWLTLYFAGEVPPFSLPLHPSGTDFQKEVWQCLLTVPYGETVTYREIADTLAPKRGVRKLSAQAVGGAVGKNPISIIIPCHRVIGSDAQLVGYAGGLEKKAFLLAHEKRVLKKTPAYPSNESKQSFPIGGNLWTILS